MNHSVLHISLLFSHWVIIFSRSKHGQNEILWSPFAFLWRLVYWTSELIKRLLAGIEFGDIKRAAIISFSSNCNKENIQERPSVPDIDKSQGVKVQNYRWENICSVASWIWKHLEFTSHLPEKFQGSVYPTTEVLHLLKYLLAEPGKNSSEVSHYAQFFLGQCCWCPSFCHESVLHPQKYLSVRSSGGRWIL